MLVSSKMIQLGGKAPNFSLPDTVSGKTVSLSELKSDIATVISFICNHCPFVHHINSKLVEVANYYQNRGVQFIAISSNDAGFYPEDGPQIMRQVARKHGYSFPYLYDESQKVGREYKAECTPDFFVYDKSLTLVYRGRFDETRPNMGLPSGSDLTAALDALLLGKQVPQEQYPSIGCSIKWK
ncbi:thioredoxin family protein [Arenibacter sp. F20364]|uniref:thioredoxin family protein n=1 Tax=Arenibacter sp. F20364 TaxID=2926415 RepID=UPI001FF3A5AA|nr:thioredoxin family protein [Arenibacter sp. F20364]MCK0192715.1 thioredoxin family protein [Arenibacter sp. F20364]